MQRFRVCCIGEALWAKHFRGYIERSVACHAIAEQCHAVRVWHAAVEGRASLF